MAATETCPMQTSDAIVGAASLDPREHLMHLEARRYALYREAATFLTGGDLPPRDH